MKPQITIQDIGGIHNKDLQETTSRIIKGGSWKKQRIIVIIPAAESIPAKVALSHWNLAFPPNNQVCRILAQGMEVGDAYSTTIQNIISHPDLSKFEYILTIEHDNAPPSHGVIKLLEDMEEHPEYDCIGGLYFTKGHGGVPQIWGDIKDPVVNFRPQPPDPTGKLVECWGTGMGFNLWRMDIFKDKKLRQPWFKTLAGKEGLATQDLYFWQDARKHGYRCAVDCSIKVGHYDINTDTMW